MQDEQEAVDIKIVGQEDLGIVFESIRDSLGRLEKAASESVAQTLKPIEGIMAEQGAWTESIEALRASITASLKPPSTAPLRDVALSLPHILELPAPQYGEIVSLIEKAEVIDQHGAKGIATLTVTTTLMLHELESLRRSQRRSHYRMLTLGIIAVVVAIVGLAVALLS